MKNRKVLNLRTHIGGLHGKTSFDAVRDQCDMEVEVVGVVIHTLNGRPLVREGKEVEILVPWPNCTEVILAKPEKDDDKPRGPGRPPKDAA